MVDIRRHRARPTGPAPAGWLPAGRGDRAARATGAPGSVAPPPLPARSADDAEVYEALVLGTRDYLGKNGFTDAVIGLSGGIDSSLVATIAVDALGSEHVHGLSMPSRYSSDGSRQRRRARWPQRLGIDLQVVPIEEAHVAFGRLLARCSGASRRRADRREPPVAGCAGCCSWASPTPTGLDRAHHRATRARWPPATPPSTATRPAGSPSSRTCPRPWSTSCAATATPGPASGPAAPIPDSVLDKPPSAELRPDQRDDQSPARPTRCSTRCSQAYVERDRTAPDLVADGFDPAVVDAVVRLVDGAEYKRRQMPPGVRITAKAFGKDRRMPITNRYRPAGATRRRPAEGGRG